jgi:UDP-3-O-[3-hydroxymyristoyl] glucosamine N-acyltransferase
MVEGTLSGDGGVTVGAVAPLDRAGPTDLSFLATSRYSAQFAATRAGVVLVSPELAEAPGSPAARIVVDKPHDAVLRVLPRLYPEVPRQSGVHPTARLGRGVSIGARVCIGPYVVVEDDARLGDDVTLDAHVVVGRGVPVGEGSHLYPHVVLYPGAVIGKRVRLHAGVRVACDGFGYVFRDGAHVRIPHVGRCVVNDDVDIGANSTLDRGSVDDTVIGAGTRIDNLVHVGHNVRLGALCLVMAQVGIAGSVHIGDGVILAGQVGVAGHLEIGAGARIGAQAGVIGNVPAGETWTGYPARPHREWLRAHAALGKLTGMLKRLERLIEDRS